MRNFIILVSIFLTLSCFYSIAFCSEALASKPPESTLETLVEAFNARDYERLWELFDPSILEIAKQQYGYFMDKPNYSRVYIEILKVEQDEDKASISAYETFDHSSEEDKSKYGSELCHYVDIDLLKKDDNWFIANMNSIPSSFSAPVYACSLM